MKTDAIASSESKALRLARYLKEFVGLRSTTVYDVNKYESALWFGDMPQEPQCPSPAWNNEFEAGYPWLVVHKQQLPKPPVPPEVILPWIDQQALKQATDEMPKLRPTRQSSTFFGSMPGSAATGTRSPSPRPPSPASKRSPWAPYPGCPRSPSIGH